MPVSAFRIGEGHDTHRTIAGRPMVVGGVLRDLVGALAQLQDDLG